nr:MAG TPA: hypothetical protein [Caudoviricetes sp.]
MKKGFVHWKEELPVLNRNFKTSNKLFLLSVRTSALNHF